MAVDLPSESGRFGNVVNEERRGVMGSQARRGDKSLGGREFGLAEILGDGQSKVIV